MTRTPEEIRRINELAMKDCNPDHVITNNSKTRHAELTEELIRIAPAMSPVMQDIVRDSLKMKSIPQLESLIKTYKEQKGE